MKNLQNEVNLSELFRSWPKWVRWLTLIAVSNLIAYAVCGALAASAGFFRNSIANPEYVMLTLGYMVPFSLIEVAFKRVLLVGLSLAGLIALTLIVLTFQNGKSPVATAVMISTIVGLIAISAVILHYLSLQAGLSGRTGVVNQGDR
jgi:hypothetical protein